MWLNSSVLLACTFAFAFGLGICLCLCLVLLIILLLTVVVTTGLFGFLLLVANGDGKRSASRWQAEVQLRAPGTCLVTVSSKVVCTLSSTF